MKKTIIKTIKYVVLNTIAFTASITVTGAMTHSLTENEHFSFGVILINYVFFGVIFNLIGVLTDRN